MSVNQISTANTFGSLVTAVSATIAVCNAATDGPQFVSNAAITLTNPGVGLNVSNTAIINTANVQVLNLTTLNTSHGTFATLNASSANLTTTVGDVATFNTLNASSANLTFVSATGATLTTANIASLNVSVFNLSSPVITGTVTGTYTLGGVPTIAAPTVSGNMTFSNLTAGSIPFIWSGGVLTQDNGALFWDNTNKRMGIGLATPIAPLHIHTGSASIAPLVQVTGPTTGASATDGLKIGLEVNSSNAYVWNHEAGKLSFGTSNTTQVTILPSGNVGIGITTPTVVLDINGTTRHRDFVEQAINTDYVWNAYWSGGSWKYRTTNFAADEYVNSTGAFVWWTAPSGSADATITFTERMRLDASGNVGIGTTSPTSPLDVRETSTRTANGQYYTISANTTYTPSANQIITDSHRHRTINGYVQVPSTSTKNVSSIHGMLGAAENFGSGSRTGRLAGVEGWAWHSPDSSTRLADSVKGVESYAEVDVGQATNLAGVDAWSGCFNGATVAAQYGVKSGVDSGAGCTVVNRFGLLLYTAGAGTVTNDYGVYQQNAPKNYFEGDIGIGAAPIERFHIYQPSAAYASELNFTNSLIGSSGYGLEVGLYANSKNAYIWNAQNGNLRLATNGTTRQTIEANGHINIVNNLNVQGSIGTQGGITATGAISSGSLSTGALTATSLSGIIVGTGNLKTAVGALTGSNYQGTVTFNDFSFFPNFQATTGSSFEFLGMSHTADDSTYVGRCAISTDDSYVIRWRYITATDTPTVWVIIDPDSQEVTSVWLSDDPPFREVEEFVEDDSGILVLQRRKIASTESPIQSNTGIAQLVTVDTLSQLTLPKKMVESADRHIDREKMKPENRLYRAIQFHARDMAPASWFHLNCGWDPVGNTIRELSSKEKKAKKVKLQIK